MNAETLNLECPGCGRPVALDQKECSCGRPLVISTFNSVAEMSLPGLNKYSRFYQKALSQQPDSPELNQSIAMCYLKLKLYSKAYEAFEKAIENDIDNSETFFYAAVSLLGGQKAFLAPRARIDKIESLLNAATMIEPRGVYYLFWAYIKFDYFKRKFFHTSPDYREMLEMAEECGYTSLDKKYLFELLGVDCPRELM
ncbi:MAG: hypothetical protein IJK96_05165 [Bacteroidales bacterium]|nr:hypothetical protein [Bacteroidales bacterium]